MRTTFLLLLVQIVCSIASAFSADSGFHITSPSTKVKWKSGDYHSITWDGIGVGAQVKLEYSVNGGTDWILIEDSAFGNSYLWHVPKAMSNQCLIRASGFRLSDSVVTLKGHSGFINTASFSRDGKLCITASDDMTAIVWNGETGEFLRSFSGHTGDVMFADISPDNKKVFTSSSDGTARLWDLNTGAVLHTLRGHVKGLVYGGFSPNGQLVATSSDDGSVRIWSSETGELFNVLPVSTVGLYCAFFSPDNKMIIAGSRDGVARIFDVATGALLQSLNHPDVVHWAGWSPNQKEIVTACRDGRAYIWSTSKFVITDILIGHKGWVWSAEFSQDGEFILTGGREGTAKVWDPVSGFCLKTFTAGGSDVGAARFSPNHDRVLTASNDNLAKIFLFGNKELLTCQTDSLFSIIDPTVSVESSNSLPSLTFNISPNPARNTIAVNGVHDWSRVSKAALFSSLGEELSEMNNIDLLGSFQRNGECEVSQLSNGMYFLVFYIEGTRVSIPFAVMRDL